MIIFYQSRQTAALSAEDLAAGMAEQELKVTEAWASVVESIAVETTARGGSGIVQSIAAKQWLNWFKR